MLSSLYLCQTKVGSISLNFNKFTSEEIKSITSYVYDLYINFLYLTKGFITFSERNQAIRR